MAGHGFAMFGWSWIEASILGSQVFGQASVEGCGYGFVKSAEEKGDLHCYLMN